MDTFFDLYFDFCWELARETWAIACFRCSLQDHDFDHTHLKASIK